jgi:hypothetical protein
MANIVACLIGLIVGLIICIFARFEQIFEYNNTKITAGGRARSMQSTKRDLRTIIIVGNEHLDKREFDAILFGGVPFNAKHIKLRDSRDFAKYAISPIAREPLIDYIYMYYDNDNKEIKQYYNIACGLKTMLDIDSHRCITDKQSLANNIRDFAPELIKDEAFPRHYTLIDAREQLEKKNAKCAFIIKPSGRSFYGGRGIYVIANIRDLNEAMDKLRKMNTPQYGISDYIWDVMTFHDPVDDKRKKFHLRGYLLVFPHSRVREKLTKLGTLSPNPPPDYCEWDMWNVCKILTARAEYIPTITNTDVTDTHASSTSENYFFPDESHRISNIPQFAELVHKQTTKIAQTILSFAWSNLRIYSESIAAYEVFGLDFLIARNTDNSPRVVLIEINDRVGMSGCGSNHPEIRDLTISSDQRYVDFSSRYFKWIFARTVIPFFGGRVDEKIQMNILDVDKRENLYYPIH